MTYNRALWLVLPVAGLIAGQGCGGPAPEPPAARAKMPVARPITASIENAALSHQSVFTATSNAGKAEPAAIAAELPTAHLSRVRPIPLAEKDDSKVAARPIGLTTSQSSRRDQALPSSIAFKSIAGTSPLGDPTDSTLTIRELTSLADKVPVAAVTKQKPLGTTEQAVKPVERPIAPPADAAKRVVISVEPTNAAKPSADEAKPSPALTESTKTEVLAPTIAPAKSVLANIDRPKSVLTIIDPSTSEGAITVPSNTTLTVIARPVSTSKVIERRPSPSLAETAKPDLAITESSKSVVLDEPAPPAPQMATSVRPAPAPAIAEQPKPGAVVAQEPKLAPTLAEQPKSVIADPDQPKRITIVAEPTKPVETIVEPATPIAVPAKPNLVVAESPRIVAPRDERLTIAPVAAQPTPELAPSEPTLAATPSPKPDPATVAMIEPRRPALPKVEAKVETKVESEQIEPTRAERTPEFIAVCQRAEGMNRHGFELAQHGAVFAARLEYLKSLETVAEALDSQRSTRIHRRMLAAGFKALDEADDFGSRNTPLGSELNVAAIVRSHRTPVLKDVQTDLSAQAAMSRYLTFAQEQLAAALGDVPQGSGALFGLGKIYSFPVEAHGPPDATGGAKSVAFYQASLMVDGRNFMAANELGVMLVGFGRLQEARSAFRHSLKVSSQPVVWENLAAVHRSLGENDLAQKAQKAAAFAATQMTNGAAAMTAYDVQWVDPATFARSKPIDADPIKPTPMSPASPASDTPKNVAGSLGFGVSGRK